MRKCPLCHAEINDNKIRGNFKCPNCKEKLTSNFFPILALSLFLIVVLSLLFQETCGDTDGIACLLISKIASVIIVYLFVFKKFLKIDNSQVE